jgi:hypothetical protein
MRVLTQMHTGGKRAITTDEIFGPCWRFAFKTFSGSYSTEARKQWMVYTPRARRARALESNHALLVATRSAGASEIVVHCHKTTYGFYRIAIVVRSTPI